MRSLTVYGGICDGTHLGLKIDTEAKYNFFAESTDEAEKTVHGVRKPFGSYSKSQSVSITDIKAHLAHHPIRASDTERYGFCIESWFHPQIDT